MSDLKAQMLDHSMARLRALRTGGSLHFDYPDDQLRCDGELTTLLRIVAFPVMQIDADYFPAGPERDPLVARAMPR